MVSCDEPRAESRQRDRKTAWRHAGPLGSGAGLPGSRGDTTGESLLGKLSQSVLDVPDHAFADAQGPAGIRFRGLAVRIEALSTSS